MKSDQVTGCQLQYPSYDGYSGSTKKCRGPSSESDLGDSVHLRQRARVARWARMNEILKGRSISSLYIVAAYAIHVDDRRAATPRAVRHLRTITDYLPALPASACHPRMHEKRTKNVKTRARQWLSGKIMTHSHALLNAFVITGAAKWRSLRRKKWCALPLYLVVATDFALNRKFQASNFWTFNKALIIS